jgi:predicted ArsR family transcriptional regulator
MEQDDVEATMAAVGALADPLRRRLYQFVTEQDHAVSRDEAAEAVDTSRSAAAFHLDRLVEAGLLETEFRRLSGRVGPGAGRPSKLYRRGSRQIALSLPPRHYDLAADLLASAVTESARSGAPVELALQRLAHRRGAELAGRVRQRCGQRPSRATQLRAAVDVLADQGYEPRLVERELVLANCPFDALVPAHAQAVCSMNLALLEGFARALPEGGFTSRLEPTEGRCCVRLDVDRRPRKRN